jgi:hypothetical protein
MASQDEIRAAERTRLEAVLREQGTNSERVTLLFSGIERSGITLARLHEAAAANESVGRLTPDPKLLDHLVRRAERRTKLGLPAVECGGDPPTRYGCSCLERALDESEGGKREVLRSARRFHWSPPPRPEPVRPAEVPLEALAEPQEPTERVFPTPEPEPKAERVRVVKHFPRWYDEREGRVPFSDMKF